MPTCIENEFNFSALICIYDYYPGSITLQQKYMINRVGIDETDPFNSDPDAPRPYTHQVINRLYCKI